MTANAMLSGKTVVVAGGAGLLGRSFVHGIVECGGTVIVADKDIRRAQEVAERTAANAPGRAEARELDITDESNISELIRVVTARHSSLDAVVNSAYPITESYGRKLEDVTYTSFCANVNLHLGGYFSVAKNFALYFQKQGYGNIVNLGSIYGIMPPRFEVYEGTDMTNPPEYAAIKSGIIHLTRYFAQYFKGSGIRINCVSPGGILEGQPASFVENYKKRCASVGLMAPNDVTGAVLFLLSDASAMMTGQNLIVDDGYSL